MEHIVQGLLVSNYPDEIKQTYLDHIILSSLDAEQQQKIAQVLWNAWPADNVPNRVVVKALKALPYQFLLCFRRYINDPSDVVQENDACFEWMQNETRLEEWHNAIKVLFLFLALRPAIQSKRIHLVFQRCPPVEFGAFLKSSELCMNVSKLSEMFIKAGRIPLIGYAGHWLRQLLLCLVYSEEWVVLVNGATDVLLNAAEQLSERNTVKGSLIVLETIFLGYQENADVFLSFFSHFYDRIKKWTDATPPLEHAILTHIHEFIQGLLFAFPGYPLMQAMLLQITSHFPPPSADFSVEAYTERLRWKNCSQAASSPLFASQTESSCEQETTSSRRIAGLTGLKNIGNSCYMNAVLQALYVTPGILALLVGTISASHKRKFSSSLGSLVDEFRAILYQMKSTSLSAFDSQTMNRFRSTLAHEYQTTRQQDAAEFLNYLLDALSTQGDKKLSEALAKTFQGTFDRKITCEACHKSSTTEENFTDIHAPVPTQEIGSFLLSQMLLTQFEPEELSERSGNAYYCDSCEQYQSATRIMQIRAAPEVLVVSINRFRYNAQRGVREKICSPVNCKGSLSLATISGDVVYSLYAVIVHAGKRADYGHYYTYARNPSNMQTWYLLNDSQVSEVRESLVENTLTNAIVDTPYVLFYHRTS